MKQLLLILLLASSQVYSQHFGTTTLAVKSLPNLPLRDTEIDTFLNAKTTYASLESNAKEWFYWTNYSRRNPKRFWDSVVQPILKIYPNFSSKYTSSLEKDLNSTPALPLVAPQEKLILTARGLASELAEANSSPSHTSPSGKSFSDRMKASGIAQCAGENISFGPQNPVLMLVLLYIDEGVPEVGHRKSLLNPLFEEMGIGSSLYNDGNSIIVQDFACKQ